MFSFLKKKNPNEININKKMIDAAINKGIKIGLTKEELLDMVSRMDKKSSPSKLNKLVDSHINHQSKSIV